MISTFCRASVTKAGNDVSISRDEYGTIRLAIYTRSGSVEFQFSGDDAYATIDALNEAFDGAMIAFDRVR